MWFRRFHSASGMTFLLFIEKSVMGCVHVDKQAKDYAHVTSFSYTSWHPVASIPSYLLYNMSVVIKCDNSCPGYLHMISLFLKLNQQYYITHSEFTVIGMGTNAPYCDSLNKLGWIDLNNLALRLWTVLYWIVQTSHRVWALYIVPCEFGN